MNNEYFNNLLYKQFYEDDDNVDDSNDDINKNSAGQGLIMTALNASPNILLGEDCKYYKMWYERGSNGSMINSYGYIEDCNATCDLSRTTQIGKCGGFLSGNINCTDKCRGGDSPFQSKHVTGGCTNPATLCKRKKEDFEAVKQGYENKCCQLNDLGVLLSLDCPPDLYKGSEGCKVYLSEYCTSEKSNGNGDKFKEPVCQAFCQENRADCQRRLEQVCSTKKPNDLEWARICGCWYPQEIYDTFRKDLESKWNTPPGTFSGPRICTFPECKSAIEGFQPLQVSSCPVTSIVSCLQQVNVDARGAVIDHSDIKISQQSECKSQFSRKDTDTGGDVKCTSDKDCLTQGYTCQQGYCKSNSSGTTCTLDKDCKTGQQCRYGKCEDITGGGNKLPSWVIIILVILGLGLLIGLIFALFGRKKAKPIITSPVLTSTSVSTPTPQPLTTV